MPWNSPSSGPCVVAHRGASADVAENTPAAFDAAIDAGAHGIELDLQRTRDGGVVVFHDRTLAAVGRPDLAVRDLPLDALRGFDVGGGDADDETVSMPTLDEILDRYVTRTHLLLEIKSRPLDRRAGLAFRVAETVVDAVRARDAFDRVFVLSFDPSCLHHAMARDARIRTVRNHEAPWRLSVDEIANHDGLCVPVASLNRVAVDRAFAAGVRLMTYAINDVDDLARARVAEVDVLMTDRPAWLTAHLADQRAIQHASQNPRQHAGALDPDDPDDREVTP